MLRTVSAHAQCGAASSEDQASLAIARAVWLYERLPRVARDAVPGVRRTIDYLADQTDRMVREIEELNDMLQAISEADSIRDCRLRAELHPSTPTTLLQTLETSRTDATFRLDRTMHLLNCVQSGLRRMHRDRDDRTTLQLSVAACEALERRAG